MTKSKGKYTHKTVRGIEGLNVALGWMRRGNEISVDAGIAGGILSRKGAIRLRKHLDKCIAETEDKKK